VTRRGAAAVAFLAAGLALTGWSTGAPATVAPAPCAPVPAVVAHRGGTERAMENTLGAFRAAGAAGVTTWELDVRFDVRGTPVVLHDATVDRVSPLSGRVADLDASDGGIPTDDGQYVPALREAYAEAVAYDAFVLTELKVMPTEAQWRVLADEIDRSVGRDSVLLMSFARDVVQAAREHVPSAATGLLHNAGYLHAEQIRPYGDAFLKSYATLSASRAAEWRAAGLRLYAWTVDHEADWARMAALPVDDVITDRPIAYRAWAARQCAAFRPAYGRPT
jgi:glycerophosphoryl diester phosphodiesterase